MNSPLVTVVVPVYNVEKYLDRCIESIVNQTYKHLEIILVDDGSPDNCPQMCDNWAKKDGRIKVLHKENAGAGMARNTGIKNSSGDYILFVDSDDYIHLKTIEECVCEIAKTQADVVMFGRSTAFAEGTVKDTPVVTDECYFSGNEVLDNILPGLFVHERGIGISSCNKLFNLQLIKDNNIKYKSEREILSEDAAFHLELFGYVKSISIIKKCFYYYFKNENSFSRSYKKELQQLNNNFLEHCIQVCEKYENKNQLINCVCARYHIYALAGMKQIVNSDLSENVKKEEIYRFFKDEVLNKTLTENVLNNEKKSIKLFYYFIKKRLYYIAFLLLKIRVRKERMHL